jgi:hypothetical protein
LDPSTIEYVPPLRADPGDLVRYVDQIIDAFVATGIYERRSVKQWLSNTELVAEADLARLRNFDVEDYTLVQHFRNRERMFMQIFDETMPP